MKLVVGLGNIGREYENTRHNIGWDAVEALAGSLGVEFSESRDFHARVAQVRIGSEKVFLALPTTFMNLSGEAVRALVDYYHIATSDILIVQDEMDYSVGKWAYLKNGSSAGHNGIASIHEALGTQAVTRLRIGIGRPTPPIAKETYVLSRFTAEEERVLQHDIIPPVIQSIQDWCTATS